MVNGTTVAPKPGLPYLHLHESAFAEAGANGLDRSSSARSTDSLQPYIRGANLHGRRSALNTARAAPRLQPRGPDQ